MLLGRGGPGKRLGSILDRLPTGVRRSRLVTMDGVLRRASMVALACRGAACNIGGVSPPPDSSVPTFAPTPPSLPTTPPNEIFPGSLGLSQTDFHFFSTTQAGVIFGTLPALGPSATSRVLLGLGLPNPDGIGCSLKLPGLSAFAQAGPALALPPLNSLAAGAYCVAIEDQFNQGPLTYTIQVWHN
jgi:hypothetical protein